MDIPKEILEAIEYVLSEHPEYKTVEGSTGNCITASDELMFRLDIINDCEPVDAYLVGNDIPHHWALIYGKYNVDLTARQFDVNADCPKIWIEPA